MKIVALLIVMMVVLFSLVTTITPGSDGYRKPNPVAEIGKEIVKPLSQVDEIGPEISQALERSGVKLPSLGLKKKIKAPADTGHMLADHTGAVFSNLDLPRTNFSGSMVGDAQFDGALLDDVIMEGASGEKVNFNKARMAKANLNAVMFPNSDFVGAELREAVARASNLSGSDFTGGDISFVSFSGSNLRNADYSGVYGAGAIFVDSDLTGAVFEKADLTGVRFDRAILKGAVFNGADMQAAKFIGTRLQGANLSGALNLTTEQLAQACASESTKLPAGVAAPRC